MPSACKLLTGPNIKPSNVKEARALIGKKVSYLRDRDIDRSGREYFFPRNGVVSDAKGRNMQIGDVWVSLSELYEMAEIS